MGTRQIQDKLKREHTLLANGAFPLLEKDVVYFFVEARKALERENRKRDFPALIFYADWVMHTKKDYIPEFVEEVFARHEEKLEAFVEMSQLREETTLFLNDYGISPVITDDRFWDTFVAKLIDVLSEQPLVMKGDVRQFVFYATSDAGITYSLDIQGSKG